jgi:anti-sigma-K factor RskA
MRMRQSLADIEAAFEEQASATRARHEAQRREIERRTRRRRLEKQHRRGSMRFWLVLATLIATAVTVTVVMFQALYWVMG